MSDEEASEEKPFAVEIAKQGRAVCKKCKEKCPQGELRIAKLVYNPFGGGKMKAWHHLKCMFEMFSKQRVTTIRIEDADDIDGFESIDEEYQKEILEKIKECEAELKQKFGNKLPPKREKVAAASTSTKTQNKLDTSVSGTSKDNLFKEFRRLVAEVAAVNSYNDKTEIIQKLFSKGTDGKSFKGDLVMWCRLLLPGVVKRIYNLQSKQLIKLFSRLLKTDLQDMMEHYENGDVSDTITEFYNKSTAIVPSKKTELTIKEVDEFLDKLTNLTKEDEQTLHFKQFLPKCKANDLKMLIKLVKHDLRMNAGAKHVLEAVHPDAYKAYQSCRDIEIVIKDCMLNKNKNVKAEIKVMTPVLPMLAEACKSVEQAMKKCPNGMLSEIKYDGERVQVHKQGKEFKYFSRSLKPVSNHKVAHFKDYIPKAFPYGDDLILDSEILMIDTKTGKPLPFGTLGVHKKAEFKDASVCLFVFDCIYYNGEILTHKPIHVRKKILKEHMKEIENHVVFSEMKEIHKPEQLSKMIAKVLKLGLEGLVLKDLGSIYEPGKRHWLKVKKDYLFDGAMADTADLIVLGAWYGTGKKGGMMSVFLMGCYDTFTKKLCTVTKVHTGHDDKTLERLQDELDMQKISGDSTKIPTWLKCTKSMIPDFVATDPEKQPVWEITGAEFTQQHDVHTANGISIRFPRVTRIRNDKTWETATSVQELTTLYKKSKEFTDVSLLMKGIKTETKDDKEEEDKKDISKTKDNVSNKHKINNKRKHEESDLESSSSSRKKNKTKRKHSSDESDSASESSSKKKNKTKRKHSSDESDTESQSSSKKINKTKRKHSSDESDTESRSSSKKNDKTKRKHSPDDSDTESRSSSKKKDKIKRKHSSDESDTESRSSSKKKDKTKRKLNSNESDTESRPSSKKKDKTVKTDTKDETKNKKPVSKPKDELSSKRKHGLDESHSESLSSSRKEDETKTDTKNDEEEEDTKPAGKSKDEVINIRKHEDSDSESPSSSSKKKDKSDEKKSGSSKESTRKRDTTPTKDEKIKIEKKELKKFELQNPLPDYFQGIKLLLEKNVEETYPELIRYFIAYSGEVVAKEKSSEATHVLHSEKIVRKTKLKCPNHVKHVAAEWIEDSLSHKTLQDYRPYTVKWNPE